ncbi:MAG: PAS domain S-box protein [Alphaproteobacteria bacterium]|nr:PAS domain S-box protein [Alphaproteobacteria bacterium]
MRIIGRPEASAGKVTGVTGALHDITDLYEKHATLMSALKDTSIALDNMGALHEVLDSHACLTMTDRRGDFTFVNDKFCDIAGFSREELIGQNYRILKSGTHEDAFFEEFWESISGGKTWRGAICNRRRNGEIFWADTTVVPLRGADGRPDRFVSIHHDITDQIHASKKRSFQARITEGIAAIQAAFIEKTLPDAFRTALDHINALTESEYGFIGEVLFDRDGQPFIHTHAITNIAWDEASRAIYAQFKSEGPIFRNLKTLFGAALLSEEPVIANDAPHDERSGGLPKGHPPLNSFLGIPIKALGRLVCMVGVANRPGGYDEALIGDLERLFSTLGQLVLSKRDRDAREASEAALARERQRLADIIDGTRAGTWEWDLRSGALQVNERWAEIVGYRQGDLVAHIDTWTALCHPHDLALSRALIHEHLSGSLPHYECEVSMRHRDGHWVWVLDRGRVASRDADGTALTMSGTQLDVSVRKNADEAVKAALREVSGFFDVSLDLLCILGLDGRIIKANQNFEPVLGYKSGELEGRNLFMVMHPDDRKEAFQIALKIIEGTEPQRFVNCCVHKDGRNLQLEWCAQLLNGRIYVAGRDITARLAYEEEIEKRRIEAEAASIAKGQFLATMSHEIRTPLNGVIGMLDLVRDKGLSAQQLPLVRDAHNAAENLLTLLNDILDFSKLESGNVPIEKLPVRVRRIVSEVCAIHSPSAQKKNIALGVEIDADVPEWVESDPTRLRQILSNLVSNAVKFTEKGHITLTAAYDPGLPLGTLRFSVRDTGLGISPDIQAKLFNRFMQADASTTRRYGGTGLGLAICKELVHLMGGEIGIESEAGKGSEFWFTLPVPMLGEVRAEENASLAPPVMPRAGLRILVVEDNALNQKIVAAYCDRIGLLHAVASTGMEAIAAVQREAYDAILMDVNLPEMDGLAATRAIRQLPGSASTIPIIALTANAMDGDREKFLQAGMDAYLPKPIDPQLLYATLATVTGGPRAPGPAVVPDHPSERLALTSPSPIKDDEIAALIADLDRIDARRRQSA